MAFENLDLVITNHAYAQYCDRVEHLERSELTIKCKQQLMSYDRREREFVHLEGVWWVFDIQADTVVFVTCYGRTNMDIPAALEWARRHKDRINLTT